MKYRLIGIYEIFTGTFGVLLVLMHGGRVVQDKSVAFGLVVGVALFAGLAGAGYMLMKKEKEAVKFSLWAQVLQVAGLTFNGTQYIFSGSAFLYVVIRDGIRLQVDDKIINYNLANVSQLFHFELRIFVLPLLIITLLLLDFRKKIKTA
jgi:hypothetical protein